MRMRFAVGVAVTAGIWSLLACKSLARAQEDATEEAIVTTHASGTPLSVTVVPDSGTDQLVGLAGTMAINIAGGAHSYEFEYNLPNVH